MYNLWCSIPICKWNKLPAENKKETQKTMSEKTPLTVSSSSSLSHNDNSNSYYHDDSSPFFQEQQQQEVTTYPNETSTNNQSQFFCNVIKVGMIVSAFVLFVISVIVAIALINHYHFKHVLYFFTHTHPLYSHTIYSSKS
jgi:hypothetical protein